MGHMGMGKCKDEITKSTYYHEKVKPQIYKTWYKILSSRDVQTRNEIFETMWKL